jgi:hypothetical protein
MGATTADLCAVVPYGWGEEAGWAVGSAMDGRGVVDRWSNRGRSILIWRLIINHTSSAW